MPISMASRSKAIWVLIAEASASRRRFESVISLLEEGHEELVGILARAKGDRSGGIDLIEDGDLGVEVVVARKRVALERANGLFHGGGMVAEAAEEFDPVEIGGVGQLHGSVSGHDSSELSRRESRKWPGRNRTVPRWPAGSRPGPRSPRLMAVVHGPVVPYRSAASDLRQGVRSSPIAFLVGHLLGHEQEVVVLLLQRLDGIDRLPEGLDLPAVHGLHLAVTQNGVAIVGRIVDEGREEELCTGRGNTEHQDEGKEKTLFGFHQCPPQPTTM